MNITKISLCFFLSTQNIHNHHTGKLKWKKIVSNEKSVPSSQFTCLWTMVDSFFWGGGPKEALDLQHMQELLKRSWDLLDTKGSHFYTHLTWNSTNLGTWHTDKEKKAVSLENMVCAVPFEMDYAVVMVVVHVILWTKMGFYNL